MAEVYNIIVGAGKLKVDGKDVGFTEDGVTLSIEREYFDVEADQSLGILRKVKIRQVVNVSTNLLEATLENLKLVWDIGNSIEEQGNTKKLSFGDDRAVVEHLLEFEGLAPGSNKKRIFRVFKAVSIEAGEHSYKKGEKTVIPVTFQAIADLSKPEGERYGEIIDEV